VRRVVALVAGLICAFCVFYTIRLLVITLTPLAQRWLT